MDDISNVSWMDDMSDVSWMDQQYLCISTHNYGKKHPCSLFERENCTEAQAHQYTSTFHCSLFFNFLLYSIQSMPVEKPKEMTT